MSTLRVSFFGRFHVTRDNFAIKNFHSQKVQSLLAYLMVYRQKAHSREVLADLFWEDTPERAPANLRAALHSLRQLIEGARGQFGSYVLSEGRALRFNTQSAYWLDVEAFEQAVAASQKASGEEKVARLREAVELYQGNLLAGFYEDWVLIEQQQHLKELYLQALKELVAYHQERREYEQAIAWARRALGTSSLHEEIHQALIQLYAFAGDRTSALKQYVECEAILKRELNLEPLPETRALYEKISRGEPLHHEVSALPTAPARHNLPRPLSSFIGRKREMPEIKRLLTGVGAQHAAPLLTLTGAGGSGKTRLALQVARDLVNEYADGVWLVELASLSDQKLVPQLVASALGVREESNRPMLDRLCDYLQSKQLVLVLDNCEHLITACAELTQTLLQRCPNLKILATSREPLDLTGEVVWKTPALLLPELENLPPGGAELVATLEQYEAVQLFVERAVSSDAGFALTSENARAVAQICLQLDGLPLAIELAAARVKALSVEEIVERLSDSLSLLTQGSRTALPRHQTLRSAIDWSFNLLSEKEQVLLRRLSVFAGGFTLETVEAVCSDKKIKRPEALDLLTQLVNKSLVNVSNREGKVRYGLLETVRQYGAEELEESHEERVLSKRHLGFFLQLAERAEPELHGSKQAEWLAHLEREHDNLRAALAGSIALEEREKGLCLAGAMLEFWDVHGHFTEGRNWLNRALESSEGVPKFAHAKVCNAGGVLANRQGDYGKAQALHEEGLAIRREIGDKHGIAMSLSNLAGVAYNQGDFGKAQALHEEGLAILREIGDRRGIAHSLNNLGSVAINPGDYGRAQALHEEGLAIMREIGDKHGIAMSLSNLAGVAYNQGDFGKAQALHEEGLAIRREIGDRQGIAWSLNNLGSVAINQGDYGRAQALIEEGLAIRREIGDRQGIAWSLNYLGSVAINQGDYGRAQALHEEGLAILREIGDRHGIAWSLNNLGSVAINQGDYGRAQALIEEGLAIMREVGDKEGIVASIVGLAGIIRVEGQPKQAACLLGAVEALLQAIGAVLDSIELSLYKQTVDTVRTQLGEEPFTQAWAEGRAMTLEQAIEYALESKERDA